MKNKSFSYNCRGFTLLELLVAGTLLIITMTFLANAVRNTSPILADLKARTELAGELRTLVDFISTDFAQAVAFSCSGSSLLLCIDGGNPRNGSADWAAPDQVVEFIQEDKTLYRQDWTSATSLLLSNNVSQFTFSCVGGTLAEIDFELEIGETKRQVHLEFDHPYIGS